MDAKTAATIHEKLRVMLLPNFPTMSSNAVWMDCTISVVYKTDASDGLCRARGVGVEPLSTI